VNALAREDRAGTRALLRLAVRRDRVKVPGWIAVLVGLTWAQAGGIAGIYPSQADRVAYAATTASSAAARLFGAVDGPSLGSIMMNELFVFVSIVIALVCSMLVVRHTRQDEETGRLELLRSAPVGRHAALAAALAFGAAVAVAIGLVLAVALVAVGLPAGGSAIMAASWAGVGLTFAGVGAVAAQLAGSARLANGIAGAVLAVAFALRAAGDVLGEVSADSMHVAIAWPSWLSPIGWGQLAYPFGAQRAWVLVLPVLAFTCLAGGAFVLAGRRDFGRGMLRQRRAASRAGASLAGPVGLAVRLHRTTVVAWTVGLVAMGAIGGVFAGAVQDMLGDNAAARELFEGIGGTDVLVDSYFGVMVAYLGLMAVGMALQVTMRLRSEERGPGEALLVAGAGRARWMTSHLLVAAVATALALALAGGAMQLLAAASGEPVDGLELVAGSIAQLPAVLVYVGAAALGFGISPRLAGWLGWGLLAFSSAALFASALDLPGWLLDLSPIEHAPMVPVEQVEVVPMLVLLGIAAAGVVVGLLRFARRDLATGA
jgi:ABC-2 type transport system permease protein